MASFERARTLWGWLLLLTSVIAASPATAETQTHSYDVFGRLIQTATSNSVTSNMNATSTYDSADNRSNYTVTGAANSTPVVGVTVMALGAFIFVPISPSP